MVIQLDQFEPRLSRRLLIIAAKVQQDLRTLKSENEILRQKCTKLEEMQKMCKCMTCEFSQPLQLNEADGRSSQHKLKTSDCLSDSDITEVSLDDPDSSFEIIANPCDKNSSCMESTRTDTTVEKLKWQLLEERNEAFYMQQGHTNLFGQRRMLALPEGLLLDTDNHHYELVDPGTPTEVLLYQIAVYRKDFVRLQERLLKLQNDSRQLQNDNRHLLNKFRESDKEVHLLRQNLAEILQRRSTTKDHASAVDSCLDSVKTAGNEHRDETKPSPSKLESDIPAAGGLSSSRRQEARNSRSANDRPETFATTEETNIRRCHLCSFENSRSESYCQYCGSALKKIRRR